MGNAFPVGGVPGQGPILKYIGGQLEVTSGIAAGAQTLGIVRVVFRPDILDAEIRQIILEHILQALVLFAIAVVLAFFLARYCTRPLRALAAAAVQIGQGKLDYPVPTGGPTETKELGASLERMRSELENLYSNLETQVAQRTEELTKTTKGLENEILERRAAQELLSLRNQELEALYETAGILARLGDFKEKCNAILENLVRIMPADMATLRIPDESGDNLTLDAAAGKLGPERPSSIPLSQGLSALALSNREPVIVNDYDVHSWAEPSAVAQGVKSGAFIPINNSADKTLGVIGVGSLNRDHFTPERVKLLTAIADGLGALLNNADLSQELQANVEDLALVDEVARIITSTLDIEEVYQRFASEITTLMDVAQAQINTVDEPNDMLSFCYVALKSGSAFKQGDMVPLQGTIAGHVARTRETLIIDELVDNDVFGTAKQLVKDGFRSAITVPLVSKDKLIGTLVILSEREKAYGSRERVILERMASQIAPAVENSSLYEDAIRLGVAVDAVGEGICITGLEGGIEFVNPALQELLGYGAADLLGEPVSKLYPGGADNPLLQIITEALCTGPWSGEVELLGKNGELVPTLEVATPMRERTAQVIGYVRINTDLRERRRAEEERRALEIRALAQSKLATIGEVATGVAHEINQPLTYLNTMIQAFQEDLTLNDLDQERMLRRLEESRRQVDRISSIVEHLRIFGHSETSEMEPLDLETVLDNTMMLMRERLIAQGIEVERRVEASLPQINGNSNQLEQVLINLFQNAMDALFGRIERGHIMITMTSANQGEAVQLEFSDDGEGIPPENLDRIFEPFFTTKRVGQGTGLGLSIVYGIVMDHHGDITCRSELTQGTTLTLTLPAQGGGNA